MKKVKKHIRIGQAEIEAGADILEPMWCEVDIYDGYEKYEQDLARFTLEQRYVLATELLKYEVENGGFDQFFYNSTGIVWEDALKGYEAAGISDAADIVRRAAEKLGGRPSFDRAERQEQLEKSGADFRDLDDLFYDLDYCDRINDYILKNAEKFYFDGMAEVYE